MARVLLGWELGGDYGHIMRFVALARELARRGHDPVFVLRELTFVDALLRDEPFKVYQAPIFAGRVGGLSSPIGFAETLMHLGFLLPSLLAGMIRGWRSLIEAIRPDLLLFDYAPTGLLATRSIITPRALIGSSFSIPPRTVPMPTYRWWQPPDRNRIISSERLVLNNANEALRRVGEPPMEHLADLLAADESFITTFPEFDQYPSRPGAQYWGAIANVETGVPPRWPDGARKRVFAYVKPQFRDLKPLMHALAATDAAVLVHSPGLSIDATRAFTRPNIIFSSEPVRMADVCRDCDAGICHAGGTAVTLTTAGKPVLLLPQHLEQMMMAKRVQQTGASLVVDFEKPAPDYKRIVQRLLTDRDLLDAAARIAQRHTHQEIGARVGRIVDRIEELIAARPIDRTMPAARVIST